ncbi:MAG TPA: Fe-S cluster assembly protein SufD [Rhodocyclaceae bacterium]|nr:Fe-S cluster assembly protein SufD [Rhodocyclaceae bacterium]
MSAVDFWLGRHRDLAASLPGAELPWLARLRETAIDRFADEGWPTMRKENWRHTSLAFMEQQALAVRSTVAPAAVVADLRARYQAALGAAQAHANKGTDAACDDGHWVVFVDGHFAPALSALGKLPAGVQVGSVAEALAQTPEAVEAAFGQAGDGEAPAALNSALAADGAWIRLARGSVVEAPIHLVFITATAADQHLRNLIVIDAGAQATVVEHYPAGAAGSTLTTAVTRVLAAQDSHVTHLKLQQEAPEAIHLASIEAEQARGAVFASHSLSFGARLARNDIRTRLAGEGAEALLNGLYHADGRRHVDHHTRIDHTRPQATSREFYRGLLDGSARGVFTGRVLVAQDAQRTDAMQRCDNLLLSRLAEADARPELEIYADDVKCAHGATVGQLDEDALFYLRSRGIDAAHARQLLTYAFAAEVLERIAHAPLRALGRAALLERLPATARLEDLS